MDLLCILIEDFFARRSERKREKRIMKQLLREYEHKRAVQKAPSLQPDDLVGWEVVNGKRTKKAPYFTVLEQISSVDVRAIKPHLDGLRSTMARADRMEVTAEPFTFALVGPARQGKTQLSINFLKILRALGIVCIERNATQDSFCDDFVYATNLARDAKTEEGKFKYLPHLTSPTERYGAIKPEVLFIDEFQSRIEDPPDIPFLLNGVVPLNWMPPMADMNNKGMNFNFAFWMLSSNHEFTAHKYSVTAIRDRIHKRCVVLDGKIYDQTCKEVMDPSGSFLGGFRTCKGEFGVWEEFVTQKTTGKSRAYAKSSTLSAGVPVGRSLTDGVSSTETTGETVSNQTFRRVKDTHSIDPTNYRCKHMKYVSFTELIIEILDAAKGKLDMAVAGAEAVQTRIDAITQVMSELSADAPPFEDGQSVRATSPDSGIDTPETKNYATGLVAAGPVKPSLF